MIYSKDAVNANLLRLKVFFVLTCVILLFSGCGGKTRSSDYLREEIDYSYIQKIAVLPFSNSTEDVLAKAHLVREEEYGGIPAVKVFFILQHIKELGDVFNVTFVTQDLRTLNVKLSAQSGEVLHHSIASLIHPDE